VKVAYVHNAIMPYKLPFLKAMERANGVDEVVAFGGRSHWPGSKFHRALVDHESPAVRSLPTVDLHVRHRGRSLHLFYSPTVARALSRYAPDVVVVGIGNVLNNPAVLRWCRRNEVPLVWHGIGSMYRRPSLLRRLADRRIRRVLEQARGGWAFNSPSKAYYVDEYGVPPAAIQVVPNILDDEQIARARRSGSETRRSSGPTGAGHLSVLFVGHLSASKRVDLLIEAVDRLVATGAPLDLTVVGDGPSRRSLETSAAHLEQVRFVGARFADVDRFYMAADIMVLPGLGGLAIHHAMCHGLPVVCSAADGSGVDLVRHGVNGFLLTEGSGREIAVHLDALRRDPDLRRRMSSEASSMVEGAFSINAVSRTVGEALKAMGIAR
jgi:glycosyltransferase involved in cell wall biosynthesis